MKKYKLILSELQILTLREGLFKIKNDKTIISDEEFKTLDEEFKKAFK